MIAFAGGVDNKNVPICQAFDEFGKNPDAEKISQNMKQWLNRTACATNVALTTQATRPSNFLCPCSPPCKEQSYRYTYTVM